ncbi:ribonuclease P protein component [Candidatus Dojkabacteria bacterium]|uniref:Ribonuclease P protein component n=1 Tax=Candidatus Dojkabacteria bacterium TaxID=2099670 RepID=A0A3M0YYY7_9BACT|nr:MAG: ribonuclease P protein component [Candidatus Dojkabacteria bacterium]
MLKKCQRLNSSEVKMISERGVKFETSNFYIKYLSCPNLKSSKIAVNVSKKIHKKAVVRNKIKRRIKAAFQSLTNTKKAKFILTVKNLNVYNLRFEEIREELKAAICDLD